MLARAELRRAWRTLLALGLLAGATLGIALAAAQVARRTSTAYDRLVEATGAPDAVVLVLGDEQRARAVTRLPEVAESWATEGGVGADRSWPARVPRCLRRHRGTAARAVHPDLRRRPRRRSRLGDRPRHLRTAGARARRPRGRPGPAVVSHTPGDHRVRHRVRRSRRALASHAGRRDRARWSTTTSRTRPRRSRPRRWPAVSSSPAAARPTCSCACAMARTRCRRSSDPCSSSRPHRNRTSVPANSSATRCTHRCGSAPRST